MENLNETPLGQIKEKKINKIAIETSTEIVKSIMEVELNKSSISTIVKDVSRKKIEKYLW